MIAIGLDRWWPTPGTRVTGARNTSVRQVIQGGELVPLPNPAPTRTWCYPGPLGEQPAVELPFSEVITIHRHLDICELRSYLNTTALEDIRDDHDINAVAGRRGRTLGPTVRRGRPRAPWRHVPPDHCSGRDIYAVSAPVVVEGAARLLDGRHRGPGAMAPGQAFDASEVLDALERDTDGLAIERDRHSSDGPVIRDGRPRQDSNL